MRKKVISIDWFQYYALNERGAQLKVDTYFQGQKNPNNGNKTMYHICPGQESHAIYRDEFTICTTKGAMVHIFMHPKMSSIDYKAVSIKVANRLLYKSDWAWYLHDIIDYFGFRVVNITRMDICCDFQEFDYKVYQNRKGEYLNHAKHPHDIKTGARAGFLGYVAHQLKPSEFIHLYLQDGEWNNAETFVREGSNKFCAYGAKRIKSTNGAKEINDSTPINITSAFEYIRWGSRNSGVCTYLYNKSQELRDKKSKPWIADRWKQAGLDEKDGDIFRVEFSIAAKGMKLKKADVKAGMKPTNPDELRNLDIDDIRTQEAMERVFWSYAYKYFSFRRVGGQKYRKDMKKATLFDVDIEPTLLPSYYNNKLNSGRSEQNAAKCLERLQWQHLELTPGQQATIMNAITILQQCGVKKRDLAQRDMTMFTDFDEMVESIRMTDQQRKQIRRTMYNELSKQIRFIDDVRVEQCMEELEAIYECAKDFAIVQKDFYKTSYVNETDETYLIPY